MAKDEEFRKVAEDVRALARSLAKDFRDAVDQSRGSGYPTSQAFRHGIRGIADEARRGVNTGIRGHSHRHHHGKRRSYPGYMGWGPPWGAYDRPAGPAGPGDPSRPGDPADAQNGYPQDYRRNGYPQWSPAPGAGWTRAPKKARSEKGAARCRKRSFPPVRRRWDATTLLGMLAVLFGVAWLLGALHAVHLSVEGVAAAGLMVLGASLVVTGRTDWSLSRHSWPVWLGVGLVAVLLATSATFGVPRALRSVSFGNTSATPVKSGTVYGGVGNLTVNARELPNNSTLDVESVAGETIINLSPDEDAVINARVSAGQICVDGRSKASGLAADFPTRTVGPAHGSRTVTIDAHQLLGNILIDGQGCAKQ